MIAAALPGRTTVLLVDDHAVVREGYRRLLERSGNITLAGEAGTADEACRLFAETSPDVVVMDISLPDLSGIEAMRRMLAHDPGTRVLIFSMYEELIYAERALQAGARGYLTKASAPNVLVQAVHAVARGQKFMSHDIAQKLALCDHAAGVGASLSAREFEILRLLVQGTSVRDIATRMGLNPKTVANHQSAIRQKLGAETAVQLMRIGEDILRNIDRRG